MAVCPVYRQDEVVRFIGKLQSASQYAEKPERRWKHIASAAARCHCSTAWIVQQVFAGKLNLISSQPEPLQLSDFLVSLAEVKELLLTTPEGMVTVAEAARLLAADVKTVHALAIFGHLPSQMADSRLANRARRLFAWADIESFAKTYIVLRALSGTRKAQYAATLAFIEQQGVAPLLLCEGVGPVFERRAIERISHLNGGEQLARLLAVEDTRLGQLFETELSSTSLQDAGGDA